MNTRSTTIFLLGFVTTGFSCYGQNQNLVANRVEQSARGGVGDTVSEIGNNIRGIYQDSKSDFWFATDGQGVYKYDGKTIIRFTKKDGLCSDNVWNVQEGRDGKIWLNTRDGICYFNGKEFTTKPVDEDIVRNVNRNHLNDELVVDHYYNGKSLSKIELPETSPLKNSNENSRFHYDIYSMLKDRKGNLWFGTCTAGVCKYDGKTYTWFEDKELGAPVRSIFEDRKGTIWIGNNGYGLFRYDGKKLVNVTRERKLENRDFVKTLKSKPGTMARVWTIAEDKQGNLWIGTIDAGVWKYDGKKMTNYTTKNGLGSDAIWTIYKDKNDNLWFGTDGAGVYKFNGRSFSKV